MQTIPSALVTVLVAIGVGVLIVQAGVAKRQLAWRQGRANRQWRRRP